MTAITSEFWQQYKYIGNLSSNPKQDTCAYVRSSSDIKQDKYKHNIWIYQNSRHFQLTAFDDEATYCWLDDESILFTSNRKKSKEEGLPQTDFFTISTLGGEAKQLFSVAMVVTDLKTLNSNEVLLSAICDVRYPDLYKASKEELKSIAKTEKDQSFVEEINQIPFYTNGGSFLSNKRSRLFHYNIDKKELKPLTKIGLQVSSFQINSDQTKCLIVGSTFKEVVDLSTDIYEMDLKTIKYKKVSKGKHMISGAYYLNHDIFALLKPFDAPFGLNQNSVIAKLNTKSSQFETIIDPVYSIGNSINSDIRLLGSPLIQVISGELFFTLNIEDHSRLMAIDKQGQVKQIVEWSGSIDGYTYYNDQWIFIALTNQNPQELYDINQQPLTSINHLEESITWIKPEPIAYEVDQRKLKGWVMLPLKYNPKMKYPAILNIHGGPKTVYGEVHVHEMQLWANQGYVVMYTNPTGADGQDNAFSDIRGKYGTVDYDDLMGFVDVVLKRYPAIDDKRLGVTGGSYGGFMTNWMIGHTQRFACAITQRSISNWTSFYGVSDIGYFFTIDQQQATLQKPLDMDKLWWHSPIKYLSNMNTPTLIIHSNKDYRCPIEQGYQLFTCLKEKRVPTKLVLFHHENHDLSRNGKPKARQKRLDEMLAWFNQYLK